MFDDYKELKNNMKTIIRLCKCINIDVNIKINTEMEEETESYASKILTICQEIDILGNYTDVNWFLDLNLYQLKTLYREAEDIWNYRAQHLTPEIKRKHIPNNDAFKLKPYKIALLILNILIIQ